MTKYLFFNETNERHYGWEILRGMRVAIRIPLHGTQCHTQLCTHNHGMAHNFPYPAHNYTYGQMLRHDDEHLAHSQDWVEVITLNTHC